MTTYPLEFDDEEEEELWEQYKRQFPRDVNVDEPLKEFIAAIADENIQIKTTIVGLTKEEGEEMDESDYEYNLNPEDY